MGTILLRRRKGRGEGVGASRGKESKILLSLERQSSRLDSDLEPLLALKALALGVCGILAAGTSQQPRRVWSGADDLLYWTWTPKASDHLAPFAENSQLKIRRERCF